MPVDGVHQNGDVGNVRHDGNEDVYHDGNEDVHHDGDDDIHHDGDSDAQHDGDVHLRMEMFIPISNVKGTTPIMRQLMLRMTIQQNYTQRQLRKYQILVLNANLSTYRE